MSGGAIEALTGLLPVLPSVGGSNIRLALSNPDIEIENDCFLKNIHLNKKDN